jgi:hypothetical protein
VIEYVRNLFLVGLVEEVRRRHAVLAHPHVERAVGLEREPAFRLIELHRRHADIHGHAVHRPVEPGLHAGEVGLDQRQPFDLGGAAGGDRIGVAVERDHLRAARQDRLRVAAGAKGRIDHHLAGGGRERGHHLVEQHGNVGSLAHSSTPFSAM